MKKRVSLLVLLSIVLAVILSACGSSDKEGASPPASSDASSTATPSPSAGEPASSPSAGAPASPAEVTIAHPLGTATVKTNPATVVVFDYGTLDTLDKLGIEVAAVPQANLPAYLDKYKDAKYANAGTLFEPDFEKLAALKPDVIFIGARTAEAYAELNKIAPTIQLTLDNADYAQSLAANIATIGQIFAKDAEAAAAVAELESATADLKAKAAGAGKALVVLTTGGKISAYGPGSRFGVIHDVYGFEAVDPNIKIDTHGNSIASEYILEKNPDVLFVVDRDSVAGGEGAQPAKDIIENELVKNTNAYKNGKIVYLDAGYWYLSGGGLVSAAEMVREAAQGAQ